MITSLLLKLTSTSVPPTVRESFFKIAEGKFLTKLIKSLNVEDHPDSTKNRDYSMTFPLWE